MRILFMAVFLAAGALWGATASNAAPFKPVAIQGIETSVATEVHYRRHYRRHYHRHHHYRPYAYVYRPYYYYPRRHYYSGFSFHIGPRYRYRHW
jgi:hypothetical protein